VLRLRLRLRCGLCAALWLCCARCFSLLLKLLYYDPLEDLLTHSLILLERSSACSAINFAATLCFALGFFFFFCGCACRAPLGVVCWCDAVLCALALCYLMTRPPIRYCCFAYVTCIAFYVIYLFMQRTRGAAAPPHTLTLIINGTHARTSARRITRI
jgi:hypothetical protein